MKLKFVQEEMQFLGMNIKCKGARWILDVIAGKKELKKLTNEQHQEIVEAWNSKDSVPSSAYRRYVPEVEENENCLQNAEKVINFFAKTLVA